MSTSRVILLCYLVPANMSYSLFIFSYIITVLAQIEQRRSNKQKWFFGAVEFKFEPNMTVLIKNLAQKVDFWANCRSNQECRSICAGTV